MSFIKAILITILLPVNVKASGFPVVDTNEVIKQVSDSLYLFTSIEGLIKEATGSNIDVQAVSEYKTELEALQREILLYKQLEDGVDDFSYGEVDRSKVFVNQVNSLSSQIKKIKTLLSTAQLIGARPEAVSTAMNVLNEERKREKEKFELALKALEEKEKVRGRRRKLMAKVNREKIVSRELEIIKNYSRKSPIRPMAVNSGRAKPRAALW